MTHTRGLPELGESSDVAVVADGQTLLHSRTLSGGTDVSTSTRATDPDPVRQRLVAATTLVERRARLAGVPTSILEAGEGPELVLLHGQGEFWGVWLRVLDELARTHHVVVADLPGHGASGMPDARLDAAHVSAWTDELLSDACQEPATLVGHLLGGAIAARYAVETASRLRQVVLVDSLGLGWYRPSPRFALPLARFAARPSAHSRDRLFTACFVDFDAVGAGYGSTWDDLRSYALACARSAENKAALRALMPRFGLRPIPPDRLASIAVPVAAIHGRHDLQVPLAVAEAVAARHGWPLYVIDGAADDPAAEQPRAFLEALDRITAGGAAGRAGKDGR